MYDYNTQRAEVFTESGQVTFLAIRDNVQRLLSRAGAVRLQEAISGTGGDSWTMLACIDRLVELKEIREVTTGKVAGQDRVFVSNR